MKLIDISEDKDILFQDIVADEMVLNCAHKLNNIGSVRGDSRLSLGKYRTPQESNRYIIESLKRKLP